MQPHFLRASTTKKIIAPLAFGALALLAVHAGAQQGPQPSSPPPAGEAAGQNPSAANPGDNNQPRWRDGRGDRGARPGLSDEDRTAFFNARLASIRAGLVLTPDQDRMWPPVESAVRDLIKLRIDARSQREARWRAAQNQPTQDQSAQDNPLERMRLRGEMQMKHGEAVKKFAEAALPLYASLSDDQKRRLRFLGRGMMGGGMGQGMGQDRGMDRGMDRRGMDRSDRGMDQRDQRGWGGRRDGREEGRREWRGRDNDGRWDSRRDDRGDDRWGRRDRDDRGGADERGGGRGGYDRDGSRDGFDDRRDNRRRWREGMGGSSDGFDRGNGIEDWRSRL